MAHLTAGRTYDIHIPDATDPIRAKVAMVDHDAAGNPAQVWIERDGGQPFLLILSGAITFTPVDEEAQPRAFNVRDLGQDDRSAEELVAEQTAKRGQGVAVGPETKQLGDDAQT